MNKTKQKNLIVILDFYVISFKIIDETHIYHLVMSNCNLVIDKIQQ